MADYDGGDYPPRDSRGRAPYPDVMNDRGDYDTDTRRPRQPRFESGGGDGAPPTNLPPPPLGDGLRPAMKRAGSQSRVSPDTRPAFPDEASYLGGRAPDLEAKNRPRDKRFRDKRDGYESDEGETLRRGDRPRRSARDDRGPDRGPEPRRQRPRDRDQYPADGPPPYDDDRGPPRRSGRDRDRYDDDPPPPRRRRDPDPYDDDPPPRRRRDAYDDDDQPPRRRRDRDRPEVEYGSEPIPARRQSERRPDGRRSRPRDYDDYDDGDEYRPRRHRSHEDYGRAPRRGDDRDYYSDRDRDGRRRRDDPYDDRRRDRSRRRYDDYDDYDDRDDRRDRDRDRRKPPKEVKIGNFDVGPLLEKGQKHYATLAPIVTPLVLNYARKYIGGKK